MGKKNHRLDESLSWEEANFSLSADSRPEIDLDRIVITPTGHVRVRQPAESPGSPDPNRGGAVAVNAQSSDDRD